MLHYFFIFSCLTLGYWWYWLLKLRITVDQIREFFSGVGWIPVVSLIFKSEELRRVCPSAQICPGCSSGHSPDISHTPSVSSRRALCCSQHSWAVSTVLGVGMWRMLSKEALHTFVPGRSLWKEGPFQFWFRDFQKIRSCWQSWFLNWYIYSCWTLDRSCPSNNMSSCMN